MLASRNRSGAARSACRSHARIHVVRSGSPWLTTAEPRRAVAGHVRTIASAVRRRRTRVLSLRPRVRSSAERAAPGWVPGDPGPGAASCVSATCLAPRAPAAAAGLPWVDAEGQDDPRETEDLEGDHHGGGGVVGAA